MKRRLPIHRLVNETVMKPGLPLHAEIGIEDYASCGIPVEYGTDRKYTPSPYGGGRTSKNTPGRGYIRPYKSKCAHTNPVCLSCASARDGRSPGFSFECERTLGEMSGTPFCMWR